jgi:hypothetical protein
MTVRVVQHRTTENEAMRIFVNLCDAFVASHT